MNVKKDASAFISSIDDPSQTTPSDEVIDRNLLSSCVKSHKNDVVGGHLPATKNCPPTNKTMMKVPPTLQDWKQENQESCDYMNLVMQMNGFCLAEVLHEELHDACNNAISNSVNACNNVIIVIKFVRELDPTDEVSVIIDGTLNS